MGISAAIGGSALIGGITSKKASDKAAKAQKRATRAAEKSAADEVNFAKEKYAYDKDRFERIYGGIEENLGKFYGSLTEQEVSGQELSALSKEFKQAKESLVANIQQRGITRSGLAADVTSQLDIANAEKKAEITGNAKFKLADAQSGFIRGSAAPSGTNVNNALQSSGNRIVNARQNEANLSQSNANSLWGSTGRLLSTGLNYAAKVYTPNAVNAGSTIDSGVGITGTKNFFDLTSGPRTIG